MAAVIPQAKVPASTQDLFKATPEKVQSTHTAEIVIALCGPIGSPLHKVATEFKEALEQDYNYECRIIRLSEIIEKHSTGISSAGRYERIQSLINAGNDLRGAHGNSILAELTIDQIARDREKQRQQKGELKFAPRRVCHIIDSIKNEDELRVLRLVYRDMLYSVGVFAPLHIREKSLQDQGMSLGQVHELIDRDSGEEIANGQSVRDTFPLSDIFLRVGVESDQDIRRKIRRFINLVLNVKIETPSSAETAMYLAASAAGNSACLSRQVGAAITDKNGEVISVGWNDVPKWGGGLYGFDPEKDATGARDMRCMNKGGVCFNDAEKDLITDQVVNELVKKGLITRENQLAASTIISKSKVKDLLEFSRSIHAEMHAIISACAMGGERIKGGKLYCTTYPCHPCARHIVATGIAEVFYIEPYRKSLAVKLHDDTVSEDEKAQSHVKILPFDGIAPARYLEFFRMTRDSRKKEGKLIKINPKVASPKCDVTIESIPALEAIITKGLVDKRLVDSEGGEHG